MPQEEGAPPRGRGQEEKNLKALAEVFEKTLGTFPEAVREEKKRLIETAFGTLKSRLAATEEFVLDTKREAVLKLKLARHFQTEETLDLNTVYDALIETPRFVDKDKGSLSRLLEIHEQKTLQRIAELRRKRAEMTGETGINPYEHLFETSSGKYHLVRLLNMPHLEDESAYMRHCVGTSTSYLNRIKRGEIEIFSFRKVPELNQETQRLENGNPVITIEYNVKTRTIEQIKKAGDAYLSPSDPFFADVIDALSQLKRSTNDAGALRDWRRINPSELENIKVKNDHVLTERGEIHYRDFDPATDALVLKYGRFNLNEKTKKEDAVKMLRIVNGVDYAPNEIALTEKDLKKRIKANEVVRAYIGPLFDGAFKTIPSSVERIYANFPESEIRQRELRDIGGKDAETLIKELDARKEEGINTSGYVLPLMRHQEFEARRMKSKETSVQFVSLSVSDMGFPNGATTDEIYAKAQMLGLALCKPDDAVYWRLDEEYTDEEQEGDYFVFGMEQIPDPDRDLFVFSVSRGGGGAWLVYHWAGPDRRWGAGRRFVFRKSALGSSQT